MNHTVANRVHTGAGRVSRPKHTKLNLVTKVRYLQLLTNNDDDKTVLYYYVRSRILRERKRSVFTESPTP